MNIQDVYDFHRLAADTRNLFDEAYPSSACCPTVATLYGYLDAIRLKAQSVHYGPEWVAFMDRIMDTYQTNPRVTKAIEEYQLALGS